MVERLWQDSWNRVALPLRMREHLPRGARHETVGCGLTETVDHPVHGVGNLCGSIPGEVLGDFIRMEPAPGPVRTAYVPFRGMKLLHTTSIAERRAVPACATGRIAARAT